MPTVDEEILGLKTRYRKENNLDLIRAVVGTADGTIVDTTAPGFIWVRLQTSNGLSAPRRALGPAGKAMSLQAGAAVNLEYDKMGQLRIAEPDNLTVIAGGGNPIANVVQPTTTATPRITQGSLETLRIIPSAPASLIVAVKGWNPIVSTTAYQFAGATVDLTAYVPASGNMCYAVIFVKSDYATTEVFASTARSIADVPLDSADIQECITAATSGSTPVWAIKLVGGQTAISQSDIDVDGVDLRQMVNTTQGSGTGNVSGPGSSTDNAITRFDGTTGKLIQSSAATLDDSGMVTAVAYKLPAATELTESSDAITITQGFHTVKAETGTTDNLATINGGSGVLFVTLQAKSGHTITIKNGTGNIFLNGGADYALSGDKTLLLFYDGTNWADVGIGGSGGSSPLTTKGDVWGYSTVDARIPVGSNGQVLTADSTQTLGVKWAAAGSFSAPAYYTYMAAMLEPLALEAAQVDTFSYAIGGSDTKYLMASFYTKIGSSGRFEVRNPQFPVPLRGVTVNGIASGASAIFMDPTLPTYTDAWTTYYDRLNTLATTAPKQIDLSGNSTKAVFLPGAYGAIIVGLTSFDYDWIIGLMPTQNGFNLWEEISDGSTKTFRYGHGCFIPVSKYTINQVESGTGAGGSPAAAATVLYVLCDSAWGKVTDSTTYIFRDDFMGASLDTATKWSRTVSTAGNIEINTAFGWVKLTGDGSWGTNGIISQTSTSRANGKVLLIDVYPGQTTSPNLVVGWHDGAGVSYTDFAHCVDFTASGSSALNIFENGNSRGAVGSGWTKGCTYRVRLTIGSSNNCTYEIQGGTEYGALGGTSWTNITPGTCSSSTTPLYAGAVINTSGATDCYIGDVRMY